MIKENNNFKGSVKQERINMNVLHSGLYFQGEPNQTRVEQIATNFSWSKFQPLDVSFREGKYNVIDGQHRLYSAKKKFTDSDKIISLPCLVRYGLSEADEMELFVELASDRRKVKRMEIYKALYGAKNRLIVDMIDTINSVGLVFDFKEAKGKNRITAIETINRIYTELGKDDFSKYLKLIKDTWGGDPVSLQRFMLYGIFEVFKNFRFDYNEKIFIKKLSQSSPIDIQREGKSDLVARGYTGYTKAIVNRYNKGLGDKKRLDTSRL